ncbi:MAG: 4-demethylwyosine synthase TYW1 [Candidatus Aenigmarchaeota archaeon]|nr:4-demethylwyosine synthase TYW1 [Candidatus Aenigmarchaeota archaeon]
MLPENVKAILEKQKYRIAGNHSAVKLCTWTKKSLRGEGVCYKEKFYGIKCHRCLQMTPAVSWCPNRCVFCWRAIEKTLGPEMTGTVDTPETILEAAIAAQRNLLTGFKGFAGTDMKKWKEAQDPNQIAISLTGEPTAYPLISDLIDLCNRKKMTTFLVTNGQFPDRLENMASPYQMYLSVDAPTKEMYRKIDAPIFKDYWERFTKTVDLMSSFTSRKAVRLTLVKGMNMSHIKEYAKIIEKINPNFVEVKAYMNVGYSKYRLSRDAMPLHSEVKEFSEKLKDELSYNLTNESAPSRVVLLSRK